MCTNLLPEVKKVLVEQGILSEWDNCDKESREQHDEEIIKRYSRPSYEDRIALWKDRNV